VTRSPNTRLKRPRKPWVWLAVIGGIPLIMLAGPLSYRLVTGRSLGLRSAAARTARLIIHPLLAAWDSRSVRGSSQGRWTNVVFLHHSVGRALVDQGDVRERLAAAGFSFWDQDYNEYGLRGPDGVPVGYGYNVPEDNTDPDGLVRIFMQHAYELPWNTFSGLLQHEVIIFKSCFPVSNIADDEQLRAYQDDYLLMRNVMDEHTDRLFIVVTPPPLNPAETSPAAAGRARAFSQWLQSPEYLQGHPNVVTFDLFGSLAEPDGRAQDANMLRQEYREGTDSHPNELANQTVGPLFADFILQSTSAYAGD